MRTFCLVVLALLALAAPAAAADERGPLPAGWPTSALEFGMSNHPGDADELRGKGDWRFRYQYLTDSWATWNEDATFVSRYVTESAARAFVPVFSYYSWLGHSGWSEGEAEVTALADPARTRAFFELLRRFYQRAGESPSVRVVLQVEPDLWGYMQYFGGDDAAAIPAAVGSSGVPELAGLPDTAAGFAQAVLRLRDRYAPNVVVGWHLSAWATRNDVVLQDLDDASVDSLTARMAGFYKSLGADFDVIFGEFSDRDAGFSGKWWDAGAFARHLRMVRGFNRAVARRLVMWQIPMGNTVMRATAPNSTAHYEDNRAEWLLGDDSRAHLAAYLDAGVIAFMFGRGADSQTCACDAAGDGITNPPASGTHTIASYSADDDGGYLVKRYGDYAGAGKLPLPVASTPGEPVPDDPGGDPSGPAGGGGPVVSMPPAKRCVSRRKLRLRLRGDIEWVRVKVGARRARTFRRRAVIDLRGLPRGRHRVRVTIRTADGRTIKRVRRYRTCARRGAAPGARRG